MRSVALLLFGIHLVFAGSHTLQYLCTTVYRNMTIEKYTVVGLVDDQQFMYFDSNTMKAVPTREWMRQNEGEDYWKIRTQTVIGHFKEYKNFMQTVVERYHSSMSDVNTFQLMYGCDIKDENTTQGYVEYGYNGEDFMSFDKTTLSWTTANPQAEIIKNQWDTDKTKLKYWQAYLESTCVERLRKIVSYGRETLERKVPPQVSLLQKDSSSPVICHATGFYPKNVTMTWKKNHEVHYENVNISLTLPNTDGSFQKSISLSVNPEEWKQNPDVYRCVVQHVGAEKEIVVLLNENNIKSNSASGSIIVKCLVFITIAIVVGGVLTAIVLAAKKRLTGWRKSRENPNSGHVKGSTTKTDLEMTKEPLKNAK